MAKKDVTIVSSMNGKGLEREYLLLRELLNQHDCYVVGEQYTNIAGATLMRSDLVICLEVIMPNALHLAQTRWLFPNSEWWMAFNDRFLPMFTKILCKTQDCYRIWCQKAGADRCVYTGFEARDLYRPDVPREVKFLHVAGESEFKNTEAVIAAWRGRGLLDNLPFRPQLTVVTRQKKYQALCEGVPDVVCIERASEDELAEMMNSHSFHLQPSAYEGFGHSLHEGIGCGAIVITTNATPMSEFVGVVPGLAIPPVKTTKRALATMYEVAEEGVVTAVRNAITASRNADYMGRLREGARATFLAEREKFRKTFLGLVGVA